jgi:Leucyl-tRNA synthetase
MADTTVPKALEALTISKTKELKGTEKRDTLIAIEKKYQKKWEEEHVFEVDAPSIDEFPLESISPEELREKYVLRGDF